MVVFKVRFTAGDGSYIDLPSDSMRLIIFIQQAGGDPDWALQRLSTGHTVELREWSFTPLGVN